MPFAEIDIVRFHIMVQHKYTHKRSLDVIISPWCHPKTPDARLYRKRLREQWTCDDINCACHDYRGSGVCDK